MKIMRSTQKEETRKVQDEKNQVLKTVSKDEKRTEEVKREIKKDRERTQTR